MDFEETNLKDSLKTVCKFFDQYEYLKVKKITNKATTYFEADGVFKDAADYLIFTRRFADSIIIDSPVIGVEIISEKATVHCRDEVYELYPVGIKKVLPASSLQDEFFIDDLMNADYIDYDKLKNNNGVLYAPISMEKIGALSKKQEACIKKILARIGGLSIHTQCRRVPAFSVFVLEDNCKVWAHIYNLETETFITGIKLYDNREDFCIPKFEEFATIIKNRMSI